jgi:hypothetical protein
MIDVKFALIVAISVQLASAFTNEMCLQERILSYVKRKSLKGISQKKDIEDVMETLLKSKGNFSLNAILLTVISSFDSLPEELRKELQLCVVNEAYIDLKCKSLLSCSECEKINHFNYNFRCPEGYKRDDLSRCKRDCEYEKKKESQIDITYDCFRQTTRVLDQYKLFDGYDECLSGGNIECQLLQNSSKYVGSCGIHEKQILFMCVPYCLNEMTKEELARLKLDPRYCVEDYIFMGQSIRDI